LSETKAKTDWSRSLWAKSGHSARELRLGKPTLPSRKADAVLAPNQNIENNPMQSNTGLPAWMLYPVKTF
jgi:hypothetical protein